MIEDKSLGSRFTLHAGDCLEVLKRLPENTMDSVVTDPPYGLSKQPKIADVLTAWLAGEPYRAKGGGFMGKAWDAFVPGPECWREVFRVMKPGAFGLVFAGTRTVDLMGVSLRLAGFEVDDMVAWLYGQGFPKSHNISKAIDKANGDERPVIGTKQVSCGTGKDFGKSAGDGAGRATVIPVTSAASAASAAWEGWGTALKPALEPILLIQKPISEATIAANVLRWGTGGLNIDGTRIETTDNRDRIGGGAKGNGNLYGASETYDSVSHAQGRFPSNLLLDEQAALALDEQSGNLSSHGGGKTTVEGFNKGTSRTRAIPKGDSGGASRFFYCAKASKRERNEGCEGLPKVLGGAMSGAETRADRPPNHTMRENHHPTVKPIALMRYLCRLVTPPNGLVLDPFTGSGSTGVAALREGFRFAGVEREPEYRAIAEARLSHSLEPQARLL